MTYHRRKPESLPWIEDRSDIRSKTLTIMISVSKLSKSHSRAGTGTGNR